MHLPVITPFAAVSAVSILICLAFLFVLGTQLFYSLKHDDGAADTWTAVAWYACVVAALVGIEVLAYREASSDNLLRFLACDGLLVLAALLVLSLRDRLVRWITVLQSRHRHRHDAPHHA